MAFAGLPPPDSSLPTHTAMDDYIQGLRDHGYHDAAENTIQSNARFTQNARDHGKIAIFNPHTKPPSADEVDVSRYYRGLPEGWELGAGEAARMETMHLRAQAAAQALRDANASEIYISSDRVVNDLRQEAYGWPYAYLMHEDAKHDAAREAASNHGFNTAEQIDAKMGFVDGRKPSYYDLPGCLRLPYPVRPTRANAEGLRQAALATGRLISAQSQATGVPAIPSTGTQSASSEVPSQRAAAPSLLNLVSAGPPEAPDAIPVHAVVTLPGLQALGLATTSCPPTAPVNTPAAPSRPSNANPVRTATTSPGLQAQGLLAASRFASVLVNAPDAASRRSDTNPVRTTAIQSTLTSPSPSTTPRLPPVPANTPNTALHRPSDITKGATKFAGFEHVIIHTAKCDVCAHHNTSVLHRCYTCGWHVCNGCMVSRNDSGKHGCMGKIEYDAGGNASGLSGSVNVLAMGNLPPLPTSGPPMRAKRGGARGGAGHGRGRGASKAGAVDGRRVSEDKVTMGKGKATEIDKGGETEGKATLDTGSDTGKMKRKAPDTTGPPRTKRKYVRKAKPTPAEVEDPMDMDSPVPSIEEPSTPVPAPTRARATTMRNNEIAMSDSEDALSSDTSSEDDEAMTLSEEEAMERALITKARGADPGPRPRANVPVEAIRESDPDLWDAANTLVGLGRTVDVGGGAGTAGARQAGDRIAYGRTGARTAGARAAGGRTAAGRALPGTARAATRAGATTGTRSGIAAPHTTPATALRTPTQGQRMFDSIRGNAFTPDTAGTANQAVRPELRNLAVAVASLQREDDEVSGGRGTRQAARKAQVNEGNGLVNAVEQAQSQAQTSRQVQGQKRTRTQVQGNGHARTQAWGQLVIDLRGTQPMVSRMIANANATTTTVGTATLTPTPNTAQTTTTTATDIGTVTPTPAPRPDSDSQGPPA
jgi:hypothetical protein